MVKINFAEVEGFTQLEKGKYHFAVTDGEVKETSPESKHPEVDFWNLELTVQDGPKEGEKEFMNIMLPPYEPFTLVSLLRATVGQHDWTDEDVQNGEFEVELDDLLGLEFVANVAPQKGNEDYNNVSRIKPYDPDKWEYADVLP